MKIIAGDFFSCNLTDYETLFIKGTILIAELIATETNSTKEIDNEYDKNALPIIDFIEGNKINIIAT